MYKELSERILKFINTYAAIRPDWPDDEDEDTPRDEDDKYTSPDAYQLIICAKQLLCNIKPTQCWSDWGSGGYKPYNSKEGKAEHNYLVSELNKIIKRKTIK